jgi:hypothetical protein
MSLIRKELIIKKYQPKFWRGIPIILKLKKITMNKVWYHYLSGEFNIIENKLSKNKKSITINNILIAENYLRCLLK